MYDLAVFAALDFERRAVIDGLRSVAPAGRPRTWRGYTADAALVPDCEQFGDLLQSGLEELRLAAAVEHPEPRSMRSERQRRIQALPSQVA